MFRHILILTCVLAALAEDGGKNGSIRQKRAVQVSRDMFRQQCLSAHNMYRSRHGVPPLQYSFDLDIFAQNYANRLAAMDSSQLVHSNGPYGENLYYSTAMIDGRTACDRWYDENRLYNYNLDQPPNFSDVGHFTQMVWSSTRFLGTGYATSRSGRTYVCCSYAPRGNMRFQYRQNVFRPRFIFQQ